MKNFVLIGIIFLISSNLFAQNCKRVIHLSGTISDKYHIKMILTFNDNEVVGFYYYEKYIEKILLEGSIKNEIITLHEVFNDEFDCVKQFIGNLSDSNFVGIWVDQEQHKKLKFNTIIDSIEVITISSQILEMEGYYKSVFNSENCSDFIELKYIIDDIFYFDISTDDQSGCTGQIIGLVQFSKKRIGKFSTKDCDEILFTFLNTHLILNENNCSFHGINCYFEGEYIKKRR